MRPEELQTILILSLIIFYKTEAVINGRNYNHLVQKNYDLTINKVVLTQKGYIQFLRYITEVPPLTEYTFCIWVRSHNFTYSHPLLSYSKHEEERLIRIWISSNGRFINGEILKHPLFKIRVNLLENHWYHICQSWSSYQNLFQLFVNKELKSSGHQTNLRNVIIPGGGDLVVGQEYTDFDKGLDDGIEGDVFGFNFVLSGTNSNSLRRFTSPPPNFIHDPPSRSHHAISPLELIDKTPRYTNHQSQTLNHESGRNDAVLSVKGYFNVGPRKSKTFDFMRFFMDYDEAPPVITKPQSRVITGFDYFDKPLGLKLVEFGFDCLKGRGAPVVGKRVLINWTKTPVRVFGGAILKNVPPFCL